MAQNHLGVDLSKDWLDIYNPKSGFDRVPNAAHDIGLWLRTLTPQDHIVFEATSGCDGLLMRAATQAQHPYVRANPLHAWHFARSLNLPKTDRVDARMLARLGRERDLRAAPGFDHTRNELAELNGRRDQLKRMETQEKNRLSKATSKAVCADIRASLAALLQRILRVEELIAAFLKAHPAIAAQAQLLESIPGIGRITSVTLVALMPELGSCGRREIASLAGLAPRARESGKWVGRRHSGGGRRHVRRNLYLAALSALRHGSFCRKWVSQMREKAKPVKVIAIAVARKILTIANAVIRDQTPFKLSS